MVRYVWHELSGTRCVVLDQVKLELPVANSVKIKYAVAVFRRIPAEATTKLHPDKRRVGSQQRSLLRTVLPASSRTETAEIR